MNASTRIFQTKVLRLAELICVLMLIVVLGIIVVPSAKRFLLKPKYVKDVSSGCYLYKAMANYAATTAGDEFPINKDFQNPSTRVHTSNEVFEILLENDMLDDKKLLFNAHSAWCRSQLQNEKVSKKVLPGENDWCYVGGLQRYSMDHRWPILANAFAPGSTTYVTDQSQKGGAWAGTRAVVIWAGGNGELVETKKQGDRYFIPRPDQPNANAFEPEGEWLAGEKIEILYPAP